MERIEYLVQCWELCASIVQGVSYLAEHPQDKRVRQDVQDGAATLKSCLEQEGILLEEGIWTALANGDAPAGTQLSSTLAEVLSKVLLQKLAGERRLKRETAEAIFQLYDSEPNPGENFCQLLFQTCQLSALTAPRNSYEYTLKLLERHPGAFSGKDSAHPGYIYQPSEQRTFLQCPICGGKGTAYYRAFSYLMGDFAPPDLPVKLWMRCESCKNLYTWQYPEAYLARAEHAQYIRPQCGASLDAVEGTSGFALFIWSNILNKLRTYAGGNRLLEVGIGKGELLAVALELGYEADAVEIDKACAQRAADMLEIPVWNGDFLCYDTEKAYDIITMRDVLEHVQDPVKALKKAHQLLAPGGVLWLSTPNFESSFSKMRKFQDPMWCEPHHVTYFSRSGLLALAESCGFSAREYAVSARYNGSMELIMTKCRLDGEGSQ